jgi:hypothetical protein
LPVEPYSESGNPEEIEDDAESESESDSEVVSSETIAEESRRDGHAEPEEPVAMRRSKSVTSKPFRFWLGDKIFEGMTDDEADSDMTPP